MKKFAGDKKFGSSFLSRYENAFKLWAVPRLPRWIETHHLTHMTLAWSAVNVATGFFIKENLLWLWIVSAMIVAQYVTDLFDGELGRQRGTGLVKWGFYMDHFLDYVFLCSLVYVGYALSPAGLEVWYFVLLVVMTGYMINSFLSFAATNEFRIYYYGIGPTETRVAFIAINTFIIYWGTRDFVWLLPAITIVCGIGLAFNVVMIQRQLWEIDMRAKKRGTVATNTAALAAGEGKNTASL